MILLKHPLGPGVPMSEARVYRFANQPLFFVYELAFALVAALWHPHEFLRAAPLHSQAIFWVVSLPVFVITYTLIHLGLLRLCQKFSIMTLWEPLIMVLAIGTMMLPTLAFFSILGIKTGGWQVMVGFFAFCFALFEIAAFGYLAFADKVLFPEVYAAPEEEAEPDGLHEVFLRGTTLPVAQVEMIRSVDEGVEVYGMGQTQLAKRRFGVVVAELPVALGFQIHRSIWISRKLALNRQKDGRSVVVTLSNGKRLPVARSRQGEFENWVHLLEQGRTRRTG